MRLCSFRLIGLALAGFAFVGMWGCGSGVRVNTITTTVTPLAGEDLAGPCTYETPIPYDTAPQIAVLVIFERGDSGELFDDASMRAMAYALHLTTVYAHQCNAKSFGDLQPDATRGPGRALFAALTQFAVLTGHAELATAPVILFGFSAAGVLSATLTHAYPDRVMGAIPFAPGSAFLNLDTVTVSAADARVPLLVLGNAQDQLSGTERGYAYFDRGRAIGARWGFGVQNQTPHCCTLSTRSLILPWIEAVARGGGSGVPSYFRCVLDGSQDGQGLVNCRIVDASITTQLVPTDDTNWLPDAATAQAWLAWVTNPKTN
jgi:dienelactone hydrolase